jgi:hypothetical protein
LANSEKIYFNLFGMISPEAMGPLIHSSWSEYVAVGGERQSSLSNSFKMERLFDEKYKDKNIR